jgi:hypothetical protein
MPIITRRTVLNSRFFLDFIMMQSFMNAFQNAVNQLESVFPSKYRCRLEIPFRMINGHISQSGRKFLITRGGLCSTLVRKLFSLNPQKIIDGNVLGRSVLCRLLSDQEAIVFDKQSLLDQLCNQLCNRMIGDVIKFYNEDEMDNICLLDILKRNIQNFLETTDMQPIDTFAILNSIRKRGLTFYHDNKSWKIHFSNAGFFKLGKSSVTIAVCPSFILEKLRFIMEHHELIPSQSDLLSMMYLSILREDRFKHILKLNPDFEMTVERPYIFWCKKIKWESERISLYLGLVAHNVFVQNLEEGYYSKKDANYYLKHTRLESFRKLFSEWYVRNRPAFQGKIFSADEESWLVTFEPVC